MYAQSRTMTMTMKRKDLEDVNDDFSDFSLSSPARKIRRLDAELPPIMEEVEPEVPLVFGQSATPPENIGTQSLPVVVDEITSAPANEERSIVLYNPMNTPLSPSPFSISINSNLISGFKNPIIWSDQSYLVKRSDLDKEQEENFVSSNGCMAVVPWVPSHSQHPEIQEPVDASQMEADATEAAEMDIEEENSTSQQQWPRNDYGSIAQGYSPWQQHCFIPQVPQNLSNPITWFDGQMR